MGSRVAEYLRNRIAGGRTPTDRVVNTIRSASRWLTDDPLGMVRLLDSQRSELIRIRKETKTIAEMAKSEGWKQVEARLVLMIEALQSSTAQFGWSNREVAHASWLMARSYANLIAMVSGPEREHEVAGRLIMSLTERMLRMTPGQTPSDNENKEEGT
jgi:hypothetical protein